MTHRTWVKIYCEGWLDGSIRAETPELRGVWVDILCLAGDLDGADGTICLAPGVGLTDAQIAARLQVDSRTWCRVKKQLVISGRINVQECNVISITKWKQYQSEYQRQKPYRAGPRCNLKL
ncbi:MAG: phage replisome organizer N-terminal domain-containing protein [bacterium]